VALAATLFVPFEWARAEVTTQLFAGAGAVAGSTPVAMAVAGWLTYGLLPLVAIVLDRDHRRRYGRPDVDALTDSTQLIRRVRTTTGHHVAGPHLTGHAWRYWLPRAPLAALVVLAVFFLPVPGGGHTDLVTTMSADRSGAAFLIGWQWACVGATLGVVLLVMRPVVTATRPRPASHQFPLIGYAAATLLSIAGLVVALLSA
jgi:hypothetical protein